MEFGILFTSHPNVDTEPYPHRDVHARVTREVLRADELGFDNAWVAEQTSDRIQNLIPPGLLNKYTRLVLVNALYFKAAWQDAFQKQLTSPQPFHVRGATSTTNVPTMMRRGWMGVTAE